MALHHVPAKHDHTGCITEPDLGDAEYVSWAGVYDAASDSYVIRVREPLPGIPVLEDGADVGFDYSSVVK